MICERMTCERMIRGRMIGMLDLREISGLPMNLDGLVIRFSGDLPEVRPSVRRLADMREVLYNQTAGGAEDLYFMYRDVALPEHRQFADRFSIRYDITVIRPGKIGGEYVKTAGHYHPRVPGEEMRYPEVYEVLNGRAHYIMQRAGACEGAVDDVIVVEAMPGDKVIVPPDYGHVTVNAGEEPLVMANCVASVFESEYEAYKKAHGAAYYEVENEGRDVFVPNDHYRGKPAPRMVEPVDLPALGLHRGLPLYRCFTGEPDRFGFLVRPQDWSSRLGELYS